MLRRKSEETDSESKTNKYKKFYIERFETQELEIKRLFNEKEEVRKNFYTNGKKKLKELNFATANLLAAFYVLALSNLDFEIPFKIMNLFLISLIFLSFLLFVLWRNGEIEEALSYEQKTKFVIAFLTIWIVVQFFTPTSFQTLITLFAFIPFLFVKHNFKRHFKNYAKKEMEFMDRTTLLLRIREESMNMLEDMDNKENEPLDNTSN